MRIKNFKQFESIIDRNKSTLEILEDIKSEIENITYLLVDEGCDVVVIRNGYDLKINIKFNEVFEMDKYGMNNFDKKYQNDQLTGPKENIETPVDSTDGYIEFIERLLEIIDPIRYTFTRKLSECLFTNNQETKKSEGVLTLTLSIIPC